MTAGREVPRIAIWTLGIVLVWPMIQFFIGSVGLFATGWLVGYRGGADFQIYGSELAAGVATFAVFAALRRWARAPSLVWLGALIAEGAPIVAVLLALLASVAGIAPPSFLSDFLIEGSDGTTLPIADQLVDVVTWRIVPSALVVVGAWAGSTKVPLALRSGAPVGSVKRTLLLVGLWAGAFALASGILAFGLWGYRDTREHSVVHATRGTEPSLVTARVTHSGGRPVEDAKVLTYTNAGYITDRTGEDGTVSIETGEGDLYFVKVNGVSVYEPDDPWHPGSQVDLNVVVKDPWVFRLTDGGVAYQRVVSMLSRAARACAKVSVAAFLVLILAAVGLADTEPSTETLVVDGGTA